MTQETNEEYSDIPEVLDAILHTSVWDACRLNKLVKKMSPSGPAFYAAEVSKEVTSASGGSTVDIIHIPTHVLNQAFSRTMLAKSWSTEPHSVALLDLMLRSSGRSSQRAAAQRTQKDRVGTQVTHGKSCGSFRCVVPRTMVLPRPTHFASCTGAAQEIITQLQNLLPLQLQRAADTLYMHTTSILLNHMYTCEPEAEIAEHLDTDYLILDWLKTKGHCSNANISLDAVREAEEAPETQQAEANRVNWQQDYHDLLLRAMAYPEAHKAPLPSTLPEETGQTLAEALLVRWASENSAIANAAIDNSSHVSPEEQRASEPAELSGLRVVNISEYSSWYELPFELRMSVQPFCIHPRLLMSAEVQVANSRKGMQVWVEWDQVLRIVLSLDLAKSFSCLCCAVNASLLTSAINTHPPE